MVSYSHGLCAITRLLLLGATCPSLPAADMSQCGIDLGQAALKCCPLNCL
jgi:hypothetical protein